MAGGASQLANGNRRLASENRHEITYWESVQLLAQFVDGLDLAATEAQSCSWYSVTNREKASLRQQQRRAESQPRRKRTGFRPTRINQNSELRCQTILAPRTENPRKPTLHSSIPLLGSEFLFGGSNSPLEILDLSRIESVISIEFDASLCPPQQP
jgi:hypothetical protein